MRTNLINLINNKIDHFRYWYVITTKMVTTNVVMDIGGGKHPQEIIPVRYRMWVVDPMIECNNDILSPIYSIKGTWDDANCIMAGLEEFPVDTVTLMDVVEHLKKEEGVRLLRETEELVDKIVVFTPYGFMEQDDGEWNTHRSGWLPEDFGDGWKVWVFPNFHYVDFRNRVLPKPHGAIFAVYDKKNRLTSPNH